VPIALIATATLIGTIASWPIGRFKLVGGYRFFNPRKHNVQRCHNLSESPASRGPGGSVDSLPNGIAGLPEGD
jgi:hypothetical protein